MIYHIATLEDWNEAIANGLYFCESLENEGFIHCSTKKQVIPTANRYFLGHDDLVLLLISEEELSPELKYESPPYPTDEKFPHIYGPLEMQSIKQAVALNPDREGGFAFPDNKITPRWWIDKPLPEMTPAEWESLCDGCARCCLYKIQDVDTEELFYTDIACRFLDMEKCICTDYKNRHVIMPTCIVLTPENVEDINWMPSTCAYRLLSEGKDLIWWHPLVTGNKETPKDAGITINQFAILEDKNNIDKLEDHVQEWLDFV